MRPRNLWNGLLKLLVKWFKIPWCRHGCFLTILQGWSWNPLAVMKCSVIKWCASEKKSTHWCYILHTHTDICESFWKIIVSLSSAWQPIIFIVTHMACDRQIRYAANNVIYIESTEFNTKEFFLWGWTVCLYTLYIDKKKKKHALTSQHLFIRNISECRH